MDGDLIRSLGAISAPSDEHSSLLGNSVAVTNVGDLLVLTADGKVQYTSLRQEKPSQALKTLPIHAHTNIDMKKFRHISANRDGSMMLLWSADQVVVVEIPQLWLREGNLLEPTEKSSSGTKLIIPTLKELCNESESRNRIVKAVFHPLCDHSVVVLRESQTLSLYDMRLDATANRHNIQLPSNLRFAGFTFGPNMEWLRYTIFLATTENEVYYLCPVIPPGTVVPSNTVKEIWSWYDTQKIAFMKSSKKDEKRDNMGRYLEMTRQYLEQTIGPRRSTTSETNSADSALVVLAGELSKLSMIAVSKGERDDVELISLGHVLLQGPLKLHKGQHENSGSADVICDITTPIVKVSGLASPVIAVAYKSGQVDLLLLDAQDDTMFFVHPGWNKVDGTFVIGKSPSMLVADTFLVKNTQTPTVWKLIPDPGFPHQLFCVDVNTSECFLLSSAWFDRAVRLLVRALEDVPSNEIDADNLDDLQSLCLPLHGDGITSSKKLNGMIAFQDPFAGHIALLRLQTGECVAVNMTMHSKLCAMQFRKTDQSFVLTSTNKLKEEFKKLTSDETARWRHTQKLIENIAKGLNEPPELEVTVDPISNQIEAPGDVYKNKKITEAAQRLEQKVLLPLTELHEATTVHMKMVEEMYKVQQEIIEGVDKAGSSNGSTLTIGLRKLIQHLMRENQQLTQRLQKSEDRYNEQRDQADSLLRLVYTRQNRQLTPAEKVYHQQLLEWVDTVKSMEKEISSIKKNTKSSIFVNVADANTSFGTPSHHSAPSARGSKIFSPSMPPLQRSTVPSTPGNIISPSSRIMPSPGVDGSSVNISDHSMSWSASKFQNASQTPTKLGFSTQYANFTPKSMINKVSTQPTEQPKWQLSGDEEKICFELLAKQNDMIEESRKKVEDLQSKVDAAKKAVAQKK